MEKTIELTNEQLSILGQCLHHHIMKVETSYNKERPHVRAYLEMCHDLLYTLTSTMDESVKV